MKKNSIFIDGGKNFLIPFVLVATLFFLWGFAHGILDVLNKHFQDSLQISKASSAMVQAVVYGGYFLMALPAGAIIKRFGYRAGVLTGLCLYGIGALLFIPASKVLTFGFFLFALFVIGCGLTCLETAANPYVTVLGPKDSAERRINLAQSLNGLGWIVGPLVGGLLLFSGSGDNTMALALPYTIVGVVVLMVAIVFTRVKLPEINEAARSGVSGIGNVSHSLWQYRHFVLGLVALFAYVAAQTGINSFFINYMIENVGISARTASLLISFGGMGLFMTGRLLGSWLMGYIKPVKLLMIMALGAVLCMACIVFVGGHLAVVTFLICFFCESIMFPTIFSLAIRGVGEHTKKASSYLIMCIVGGAVAPVLMGHIGDVASMSLAFIVPMVCFIIILTYTISYKRLYNGC